MIRSFFRISILALALLSQAQRGHADMADFGRILKRVVALGADVATDVPAVSIQRGLKRADLPDGFTKLPDGKALHTLLKSRDPALLRQFETLAPDDAAIVVWLFEGSEALRKASPDALTRARAMEKGGGDLILASARYGDEMTAPAFRVLAAEDAGQLPLGSLQQFSETVAIRGEQVLKVWSRYILPNWKQLAAAGVLADVVFNDAEWVSAAGEMTTEGLEKLVKIGVEVVVETAIQVPKQVAKSIWERLWSVDGPWVLLLLAVVALPLAIWLSRRVKGGINMLMSIWRPFVRKTPPINETTSSIPSRSRLAARASSVKKKR